MTENDRLQYLFEIASELEPALREEFLKRECAGNSGLLEELLGLLAGDAVARDNPAWEKHALAMLAAQVEKKNGEGIGGMIGPYRTEAVIGTGGMGKVYRAVRSDDEFHQRVAIKLIRFGEDACDIVERFRNERQILATLEHPNIAHLLDGGTTAKGRPYFAMEYVEGEPLDRWCEKHKPGLEQKLAIFRQVCAAVQYAHQRMVIHRDLKPGNILVTPDGTPKLVDFGISKVLEAEPNEDHAATATMTGMRMMTPRYASPEQVRGERVTTASDIFSLGVILYELLAERSPYESPTAATHEVMRAVCEEEPRKPSSVSPALRGDLDNIVLMALRKDPLRRYASVDQFSEDIRRFEEGYPVLARPDTRRYRAARFVRRNRTGVAAAVLLLLSLVGGVAAFAWEAHVANQRFQDVRQLAHSVIYDYHDAAANLPGALALRNRMVKDGREYLDRLSKQARGDRELQLELAGGYLKVADVQADVLHANLGDTKGGLESYGKAIALLEELQRRDPGNEEVAEELAVAYQHLGALRLQTGNPQGAVTELQKGIKIFERLCATGRNESKLKLWSGVVNDRRAWLAPMYGYLARAVGEPSGASLGDSVAAERWYRKELALYDAMGRNPKLLVSIGSVHSNLGGLLTNADKNAEALQEYQRALEIDLELSKSRGDPLARRELAIAFHNVGVGFLGTKQYPEAIASFRNAETHFQALADADANDVNIRVNLADNTRRVAECLLRLKDYGASIATYRLAIARYQETTAKDPQHAAARYRMGLAFLGLSLVQSELRDAGATIDASTRAAAVFEAQGAGNRAARQNLARAWYQTGQGYAIGGNWGAARDWDQKTVDLWRDIQAKGQLAGYNAKRPGEATAALAEANMHLPPAKP